MAHPSKTVLRAAESVCFALRAPGRPDQMTGGGGERGGLLGTRHAGVCPGAHQFVSAVAAPSPRKREPRPRCQAGNLDSTSSRCVLDDKTSRIEEDSPIEWLDDKWTNG